MISSGQYLAELREQVDDLHVKAFHTCKVFPDNSNETCQFTAGALANEWSALADVVDNNGVTLLSKFGGKAVHIGVINVEQTSANVIYIAELYCGGVVFTVVRFKGGPVPKQSEQVCGTVIPAGCPSIQYRMKCATGGATANLNCRWHEHC